MAEPEAPASGGSIKDALSRKIGPLPAGVWMIIVAGVFWYVSQHQKKSASTAGQATDPAGNVGTIDPKTGYVYDSPEDQAGLSSGSSGLGTSSDSGTGTSTTSGQYADNNAWAVAAINYLVSIGVDATEANTAITQFLASQTLTAQQQADVNLVIQRLGAPPSPPQPGGNTPPIVTPPSATTYATNPPSGFTTTSVSSSSIGAKWNSATNATSYTLSWGTTPDAKDGKVTVSTTSGTATGLKPNTLYYLHVQANPVKSGAGFASLSKTTAKSTSSGGGGGSGKPGTRIVTVVAWEKSGTPWNSTLWGIAEHYHVKGGYQELAKLNNIKDPNKIYPGQKIKVPVS